MENDNRSSPIQLEDLKPKTLLRGIVTKIELFGAFVDVGSEMPGLLHISKLRREQVNRVQDVLQEGQEVEVWVDRVDPELHRLELSMIRPVELKWRDIVPGKKVTGKVVRVEKFGAFVDIGAARPGLVHVSEMSTSYIADPAEVVRVGDKVEVTILDVDRKKRQMRLSMKVEEKEEDLIEETEEEPPTAMEVALRRALNESDENEMVTKYKGTTRQKRGKGREELEDIFTRTLEQRVKASSDD
jgi:small subunit ribosomal protein S1